MEYNLVIINLLTIGVLLMGLILTAIGLPGNVVIFVTALTYGYFEGFSHITYSVLLLILAAFLAGEAIEFVAGSLGAKKGNASRRAVWAAFLGGIAGGIIGTGMAPGIGSLLGAVAGAFASGFAAELSKTGDITKAGQVAKSIVIGQVLGIIAKLAIAFGMVILLISKLVWTG
ncbi:MAG TPA: DUF456 domain-containing protein [Methylomusa anaerophila]|uniref:DUF456 domain-containing protein n=1 Tax=Methylomusa anaerophila TaxID=1930071 RepID=A0A348AMP6_9FIRM|nr:DUF456 domain-containing protein [Methylomusa anaerophila]BBB92344.1 hypothetical protein MAMMFC1_03037 [Methylomusa anaerophila]HML90017.1 DUF456 domain-containing protein [Methylomusa anaerophila]